MKVRHFIAHYIFLLVFWTAVSPTLLFGQERCATPQNFQPVTALNQIGWDKFPEFKLPFTLVFGGPRLTEAPLSPLRRGFSHLSQLQNAEYGVITKQQIALEFYGVAYGLNQPWETLESPWGNDLTAYRSKWEQWLRDHSTGPNAQGKWIPLFSTLMVDIERVLETDARILQLKTNPQTPSDIRQLSDAQFLARYKRDMTNLYAESVRYLRERGDFTNVKITSYSDVPIRNTYLNVVGNTWQDWTTNVNRVSFLFLDPDTGQPGGPFAQQLDFLQPSVYYYYDYPNPLAPDYLAYTLFQIEANRAWSTKPVIPAVWMRFHECCGSNPKYIQPFMAEATGIFPFMAGAKGLWVWEQPGFRDNSLPMSAYEYFLQGLYRLSQFSSLFDGNYELVSGTPAPELIDKQLPVWRGVFKNNKLLIAAHNPYARDGQQTTVKVSYKSWEQTITLTGREVYLCQYDLSILGLEPKRLDNFTVSPNPTKSPITVRFNALTAGTVEIQIVNMAGQLVKRQTNQTSAGPNELDCNLETLPAGAYIVRVLDGATSVQQKIIKN